jgi:hypothetical protein
MENIDTLDVAIDFRDVRCMFLANKEKRMLDGEEVKSHSFLCFKWEEAIPKYKTVQGMCVTVVYRNGEEQDIKYWGNLQEQGKTFFQQYQTWLGEHMSLVAGR